MLASLKLKRSSIFIGQDKKEDEKWEFLENLKAKVGSGEVANNH